MPRARTPVRCRKRKPRRRKPTAESFQKAAPSGAAFLYGAAASHTAHRFVERDSDRGLSMRIVSGIALALLMSPASGETLVERGAYLVNSVMVCHNCHTPRGPQGLDLSRALSGGSQVFDEPAFKVSGSNTTPDKDTGIGSWTDAELKRFLVSGVRPNGTRVPPIIPTAFYTGRPSRDRD